MRPAGRVFETPDLDLANEQCMKAESFTSEITARTNDNHQA